MESGNRHLESGVDRNELTTHDGNLTGWRFSRPRALGSIAGRNAARDDFVNEQRNVEQVSNRAGPWLSQAAEMRGQ